MTNTSTNGPWIPICCEPGKLYSNESRCHQNANFTTDELVFPVIYDFNLSISTRTPTDFVPRYGIPCSDDRGYYLKRDTAENDSSYLFENGTIYVSNSAFGAPTLLEIEDYCLTSYATENETLSAVFACAASSSKDDSHFTTEYLTIYATVTSLSIPFILATLIVYTILPELRNTHGSILRMYLTGLLVTQTLVAVLIAKPVLFCVYIIGITVQFGILSNYLWLNVMSFDIWWTFRTLQDSSKHRNRKKFAMYSTYAWGFSALLTGVSMIIDLFPTLPTGVIRPGLRNGCWFADDTASLIYFDGPIELTIVCNIIFFVLTAMLIFRNAKSTATHFKGQTDEKQRFKLYLKLCSVMGMTEIGELISNVWPGLPASIKLILELPSALQGLSIFIIFVCKNNVKQMLLKRLRCKSFRSKKPTSRTSPNSSSNNSSTTTSTMIQLEEHGNIPAVQPEATTDKSNSFRNSEKRPRDH